MNPVGVGFEAGVVRKVGMADALAKTVPETFSADPNIEGFIFGLIDPVRDYHGVGVAEFWGRVSGQEVTGNDVGQPGGLTFDQSQIEQLASSRLVAGLQGGQNADGGVQAGGHVGHRGWETGGRAVRFACQGHGACFALGDNVVASFARFGAGVAVAADGGIDDAGIGGGNGFVVDAVFFPGGLAGHVEQEDVGRFQQLFDDFLPFGRLDVEGQAAFVAVEAHEVGRLAFDEGRAVASSLVTLIRPFDLNHIGPKIAQHHGTNRASQGFG